MRIALAFVLVLTAGCSGQAPYCEADIIVDGAVKHYERDVTTCLVATFANGTTNIHMWTTADDTLAITVSSDKDFVTSPGYGGFKYAGETHYGGGSWVSQGHDWEIVFSASDGAIGGDIRGAP